MKLAPCLVGRRAESAHSSRAGQGGKLRQDVASDGACSASCTGSPSVRYNPSHDEHQSVLAGAPALGRHPRTAGHHRGGPSADGHPAAAAAAAGVDRPGGGDQRRGARAGSGWVGRCSEWMLPATLALDVVILTGLLFFTGGPFNPFSFLYLVHIALAAVVLRARWTWALVALSLVCSGALFYAHVWLKLDYSDPAKPRAAHAHAPGGHVGRRSAVAAAFIVYFVTRDPAGAGAGGTRRRAPARNERLASLAHAGGGRGPRAGDAARDHRGRGPRAEPARRSGAGAASAGGRAPDPRPGRALPHDPRPDGGRRGRGGRRGGAADRRSASWSPTRSASCRRRRR